MRFPYHRAISHVGMLKQTSLDLCRIDVHACRDDEIVTSITDEKIAVLVQIAQVSDSDKLSRSTLLSSRRVVLILERLPRVRLDIDGSNAVPWQLFTRVIQYLHCRSGQRLADGSWILQPVLRTDDGALRFGSAVGFPNNRPPPVEHRTLDADRTGRAAVSDES